jgi:hypothetical protein
MTMKTLHFEKLSSVGGAEPHGVMDGGRQLDGSDVVETHTGWDPKDGDYVHVRYTDGTADVLYEDGKPKTTHRHY